MEVLLWLNCRSSGPDPPADGTATRRVAYWLLHLAQAVCNNNYATRILPQTVGTPDNIK